MYIVRSRYKNGTEKGARVCVKVKTSRRLFEKNAYDVTRRFRAHEIKRTKSGLCSRKLLRIYANKKRNKGGEADESMFR